MAFCPVPEHVKASEPDSLFRLISQSKSDSLKVDLLNALSKSYFNINPDSSVFYSVASRSLANKIGYQRGVALAIKNTGIGLYMQGKYIEAINNWDQALNLYKQLGDKSGEATIYSNMGAVYFNQGDDAKSLELQLNALKIAEEVHDTMRIVISLSNIGAIYLNKPATYRKALEFFLRALPISLAYGDAYNSGLVTVNLGEIYYKLNDDSTALYYLNESLKYTGEGEGAPYAKNYIGRVFSRQGNYNRAIAEHDEAFLIAKKLDLKLDMTQSLIARAQVQLKSGAITNAIHDFFESLELARSLNANTEIKDVYEGLTQAYAARSDFANAFKYQNLLLGIKDTIYNINTDKKLGTLQFTFDLEKKENQISLLTKDIEIQQQVAQRQRLIRNGFMGGFAVVVVFAGVFFFQRNRIGKEKKRSDELLLNILPEETAEELKSTGSAKAKSFESVSVLFTDFKNFTQASEILSPEELVAEINYCYSEFDKIITRHGLEKIKTIGDAYMCAGGLPVPNLSHAMDTVSAGLEMVEFTEKNKQLRIQKGQPYFELRCGIHSGPVVAGVVGTKKFAYDIWGDTVNTASRMESSGEIGKVNISGTTFELVREKFKCTYRGKIKAKNKGEIDMYFVDGLMNS